MTSAAAALQLGLHSHDVSFHPSRCRRLCRRRRAVLPIALASSTSPASAASPGRSADELARFLAGLCALTDGGVGATESDVRAAQRAAHELDAFAAAAAARVAVTNEEDLAGTRWRLVGCLQRTLPSPASWLVGNEGEKKKYFFVTIRVNIINPCSY